METIDDCIRAGAKADAQKTAKAAKRRKPSIGAPRKERGLALEARLIKRLNRIT
jgi:hypothetical protein